MDRSAHTSIAWLLEVDDTPVPRRPGFPLPSKRQEILGDASVHLSNVVMPGMGGRHLMSLAADSSGMKVLYMSGYTSDTIVRHGVLEAQMPFLNKPFTAAQLLRKVLEVP